MHCTCNTRICHKKHFTIIYYIHINKFDYNTCVKRRHPSGGHYCYKIIKHDVDRIRICIYHILEPQLLPRKLEEEKSCAIAKRE